MVNKEVKNVIQNKKMSTMRHKTQNYHFIIYTPISYYCYLLFLTSLNFMDHYQKFCNFAHFFQIFIDPLKKNMFMSG